MEPDISTLRKTGHFYFALTQSYFVPRRCFNLSPDFKSFHEKAGRGQDTLRFFLSVSLFPFS